MLGLLALGGCLPGAGADVGGGSDAGAISVSALPPEAEMPVAEPTPGPSPDEIVEAPAAPVTFEPPRAPPLPPALAAQQRQCAAGGGQMSRRGDGLFVCVRQTRDGGQRCTRSGDCEGYCLARSGSCAPIAPLFGCHEVLGRDGARTTLCVE
ncbi:MAG: hypothetical protein ACK4LQ_08845 [Pararhodobacter sp.]